MACLIEMLGLYKISHPSSSWKCCWCECNSVDIASFEMDSWPLQDINKMIKLADELKEKEEKLDPTRHAAQKVYPFSLFYTNG